ncbi:MAG: hypothetical protein Kow0059_21260 [Candidatus Sumerlaeia bacterium]
MSLPDALRLTTFVMALWCFGALASTGELPWFTVAAMSAGFSASLFKQRLARLFTPPRWVGTLITISALALAVLYCLPDVGGRLLGAVLHFFLYLEIVKLFALHPRPEDHLHVAIIGFFQIVAVAVSTQSWTFLIVIAGYIVLASVLLVLINAGRDAQDVRRGYERDRRRFDAAGGAPWHRMEHVLVQPHRIRVQVVHVVRFALPSWLILLVAAVIFIVIPRFSANQPFLGISKPRPVQTTGFNSDVDLQAADQILTDPTIVMRVYPDKASDGDWAHEPIYLRATSLDYFGRQRWTKRLFFFRRPTVMTDRVDFPDVPVSLARRVTTGRVVTENPDLNFAFAIDFPLEFRLPRPMLAEFDAEAFSLRFESPVRQQMLEYRFKSVQLRPAVEIYALLQQRRAPRNIGGSDEPDPQAPDPAPAAAPLPPPQLPDSIREFYLRLPGERWRSGRLADDPRSDELTGRIEQLAGQLLDPGDSDLVRAIRLQNYLKTNYEYTLDLRRLNGGDPLEQFLFHHKKGHCELFATSLALLLRAAGVPARVVSGFLTDEWNSFGSYYVVREYHAHTWVEAWIEGLGWVRLDPTPGGAVLGAGRRHPVLAGIAHYLDWFRIHWYRYVIDYKLEDQQGLMARFELGRVSLGRPLGRAGEAVSRVFSAMSGVEPSRINTKNLILLIAAMGLSLAFLGRGLWQVAGRRARPAGAPASRARCDAAAFYYDILNQLKKKGYVRAPSQTAVEFAHQLVQNRPQWAALTDLTRVYYRLRFSPDGTLTRDEQRLIREFCENFD